MKSVIQYTNVTVSEAFDQLHKEIIKGVKKSHKPIVLGVLLQDLTCPQNMGIVSQAKPMNVNWVDKKTGVVTL